MRDTGRRGRNGRILRVGAALVVSFGLVAAACGNKKDEGGETSTQTTGAPSATSAVATSAAGGSTDTSGNTVVESTESSAPAVKPTPGGSIIVSGEAKVANPWTPAKMVCDSYCNQRARSFFDPLGTYGEDNKVHPFLAKSFAHNDDATVWTVTLRPGITFTDGTPVDADAVIYNLQQSGTGLLLSGLLTDVAKNADGSLKIEKTGDLTFDIYTGRNGDPNQPTPWFTFEFMFTSQWGLIASPTWLKAVAAGTASETAPVGSGPFTVKSFSDDELVVVRNPDYWQKDAWGQQLPYLDQITYRVIDDSETAAAALRNGDIQGFATSQGQTIADFRAQAAKFPMVEQATLGETNHVMLHLTNPTFADERIRCAMSKAIDRQELIDSVGGGIAQVANGVFSPGQQGYLEDNGFDPAQDVEGAKKLVDEYVAETGQKPTVIYGTTTSSANERTAELLKGYWDAVGITTKVQMVEQSSFITNALLGIPEFEAYGWRQFAGVTVDAQWHWWDSRSARPDGQLSLNFSRLNDPVIDENLDKVRASEDPADQEQAAEAINREMAAKCWQIPTSFTIWGIPHIPALKGFGETPIPDTDIKAADGAGFSGSYWTNALWLEK